MVVGGIYSGLKLEQGKLMIINFFTNCVRPSECGECWPLASV